MQTNTPTTISPALPAGYVLHEYEIISILGMGGFGITYLATDTHLQLKVAIKEFFPSSLAIRDSASGSVAVNSEQSQEDFAWGKSRFIKEAQTLARFTHPNIVHVYRFFEANSTSYMVMAYEEGKSLEDVLVNASETWDKQRIIDFVTPLLDGLAVIHESGFLHRDIKPSNIFIRTKDDSPVLLDFGSARLAVSTQAITSLISPGYGPIEQYFDQGTQGPWSDIYSMGAVLYRIVSGTPPVPAIQRVKKDSMLPAVFAGMGKFPSPFLKAIDIALSIDETKRPQKVGDWASLLKTNTVNECIEKDSSISTTPQLDNSQNGDENASLLNANIESKSRQPHRSKALIKLKKILTLAVKNPLRITLLFISLGLMGVGLQALNIPQESDLEFAYRDYHNAIRKLDLTTAYNYYTTFSKRVIPFDYFKSFHTEKVRNEVDENIINIAFIGKDNELATIYTSVLTNGKDTHIYPQRWKKYDGAWYKDKAYEMQYRMSLDESSANLKPANFTILNPQTSWELMKRDGYLTKAHPVTSFQIKNDGNQVINFLYLHIEYFDAAQKKTLAYSEDFVVKPSNSILEGETSLELSLGKTNHSSGFFITDSNTFNESYFQKNIETRFYIAIEDSLIWSQKQASGNIINLGILGISNSKNIEGHLYQDLGNVKKLISAANKGDVYAQNFLADYYYYLKPANYLEAFNWYKKAAEQDSSPAIVSLGWMYQNGLGVEQNYQQAIFWYRKAESKHSQAQNNLGELYEKGLGVEKNEKEAASWYKKAAMRNNEEAQFRFGRLCENGLGVEKDIIRAYKSYSLAADSGFKEAFVAMTRLKKEMTLEQLALAEGSKKEWLQAYCVTGLDNDYRAAFNYNLCNKRVAVP